MRRKRIIAYFMLAVAILVAACASKDDQPESKTESETVITSENAPSSDSSGEKSVEPAEQNVEFKAIYVRTDGYHDGEKYPRASWITTPDEIQEYYEANKDKYYLESIGHPYSDQTVSGFTEAVKDYDEAFFRDYDLIFVVLEEGSGSIRHEVTAVKALRLDDGKHSLQTEITRLIPEVGTDDMAEWHVILEIPKEFGKGTYDLEEPIMKDRNTWDPSATEVEIPTADTASVVGPYGQISVYIPASWTAEAIPVGSEVLANGLYGLALWPRNASDGQIQIIYTDMFGVCGTGLATEERKLAGDVAGIGTYDNHDHWDFITFGSGKANLVAMHTDCSSWTDNDWNDAMDILDTMKFDETVREGGVGQYIPESENDEIAVIMEVTNVTATGLTVHFRQYDEREIGTLIYGEQYWLERQQGDDWIQVPTIIDAYAFHDIGYIIPKTDESTLETEWEWLYGKLSSGTYRITKTVDQHKNYGDGVYATYQLTAQFVIG